MPSQTKVIAKKKGFQAKSDGSARKKKGLLGQVRLQCWRRRGDLRPCQTALPRKKEGLLDQVRPQCQKRTERLLGQVKPQCRKTRGAFSPSQTTVLAKKKGF